jgi:hypothetical protein
MVLRTNQEIRAPRLLMHGTECTQHHPTSRLFGHQVPGLCLNKGKTTEMSRIQIQTSACQ